MSDEGAYVLVHLLDDRVLDNLTGSMVHYRILQRWKERGRSSTAHRRETSKTGGSNSFEIAGLIHGWACRDMQSSRECGVKVNAPKRTTSSCIQNYIDRALEDM